MRVMHRVEERMFAIKIGWYKEPNAGDESSEEEDSFEEEVAEEPEEAKVLR